MALTKWQKDHRARRRAALNALKDLPCIDCGQMFLPCCMDFDHREPDKKIKDVSYLVVSSYSWASVLEEIEKCDLICANCHRIRTFRSKKES